MAYVTRLNHFRFEKHGDRLVIKSELDDFERDYPWPDRMDIRDADVDIDLHEQFYTHVLKEYENE